MQSRGILAGPPCI